MAGLGMDAQRHAEGLRTIVDRVEHGGPHIAAINIGWKHRRDRASLGEIFELFDSCLGRLAGNQANGEKAFGIGGAVFQQPLVHGVA